ncbi:uncharacterized protein AMSG_11291 [Thecamonas trahens ATCC 50062]|uniref:Transmembrane protein 184C n=1 Tax=Thecamonas trahens ATCC 50062 TaxID=461836 RepID=A0A0L0DWF3_THETB|nr:hypothetical protein AMSG_11291 [Thecamonas trahens ATCC 50062]KNC55848.1 hypothetical protein AMSG_11291 [Thecamonas trahens ATCC 50062]|eukprot:XP_013752774.1 hypothetical protein AMSG_11291 [Thecamonas trahens ATCC 50062]
MVEKHVIAFIVAGVCTVVATVLSAGHIFLHLTNFNQPETQRYIMRILLLVPIYAIDSWLSLYFHHWSLYLDTVRDVYEAYVIYNFFSLLITYLGGVSSASAVLARKPPLKHPLPLRWILQPMDVASPGFLHKCKLGALQFVLIKPAMAVVAVVCEATGNYHEGEILDYKAGYLYVTFINNVAVTTAMYALVVFYLSTKAELAPQQPMLKFLCIKAVVFFAFWQSIVIALLVKIDVIHDAGSWTSEDVATGLQDFLICVEMLVAAIFHRFAFTHAPYVIVSGAATHKTPLLASARSAMSVADVLTDTHQTIVSPLTAASVSAINKIPIPGRRRRGADGRIVSAL